LEFLVSDSMKKIVLLVSVLCMLWSCGGENPAPDGPFPYAAPGTEGMNSNLLMRMDQDIKAGSFGEIHSMLILRNGKLVFENYYSGYQRNDLHALGASTQSIVSALVGVQTFRDDSFTLTEKVVDYFADYPEFFQDIPLKDQIELWHLLSHQSGLMWDEWGSPFGTDDNDAYQMSISADWIGKVLSSPMIKEPGKIFNFNSGHPVLMVPILESEAGMDLEQMADETLFSPLGIDQWQWERIPGDFVNGAWGLQLKPIDMMKIGYLYLNNGRWGDKVLFSESWGLQSTRTSSFVSFYFGYGYWWWRFTRNIDVVQSLSTNDVYFSWGEGGQYIFIIPSKNLVVVSTAGNYNQNETQAMEILRDYIFPSVAD
jgi:CubicO group peptidase (beta-lactamase class C family)